MRDFSMHLVLNGNLAHAAHWTKARIAGTVTKHYLYFGIETSTVPAPTETPVVMRFIQREAPDGLRRETFIARGPTTRTTIHMVAKTIHQFSCRLLTVCSIEMAGALGVW